MRSDVQNGKDHEAVIGIKEMLFNHRLHPGQKIIYHELENALGMSKTPIINALNRLEQEGLVVYRKNRGYFVRQLTSRDVDQMYDLRTRLEAIAIDYAVLNGDKAGLTQLKQALENYVSYKSEVYDPRLFQLDIGFHVGIARMGQNEFLTDMLINFYETAWVGLQVTFLTSQLAEFKRDHRGIYEAIANEDARSAKRISKKHWEKALDCVLKGYRET